MFLYSVNKKNLISLAVLCGGDWLRTSQEIHVSDTELGFTHVPEKAKTFCREENAVPGAKVSDCSPLSLVALEPNPEPANDGEFIFLLPLDEVPTFVGKATSVGTVGLQQAYIEEGLAAIRCTSPNSYLIAHARDVGKAFYSFNAILWVEYGYRVPASLSRLHADCMILWSKERMICATPQWASTHHLIKFNRIPIGKATSQKPTPDHKLDVRLSLITRTQARLANYWLVPAQAAVSWLEEQLQAGHDLNHLRVQEFFYEERKSPLVLIRLRPGQTGVTPTEGLALAEHEQCPTVLLPQSQSIDPPLTSAQITRIFSISPEKLILVMDQGSEGIHWCSIRTSGFVQVRLFLLGRTKWTSVSVEVVP